MVLAEFQPRSAVDAEWLDRRQSRIIRVFSRLGTSPTEITVISFISLVSIAETAPIFELETYMVLLSGVNVTQLGKLEIGPWSGSLIAGSATSPTSLSSLSE